MRGKFAFTSALAGALLCLSTSVSAAGTLQIIQFDFEGGGGTLFITPHRHAVLVDAGWPADVGRQAGARSESDAGRIAAELKRRRVPGLDYLVVTHYHVDHVGGVVELLRLVPVGTLMDHGTNREPPVPAASDQQRANSAEAQYASYMAAIGDRTRRVVAPGDQLSVDGLKIEITNADGATLRAALPGAGGPGTNCPSAATGHGGGEENARSVGLVARFGRARIVSLGDTTRDVESRLVCPVDLIGGADVVVATHHGSAQSNDPAIYATLRPRVVLIPNGATKGGDPAAYDSITAARGTKGVWQLHEAIRPGAKNTARERIANLAGGRDQSNSLLLSITADGAVRVTNSRTGHSEAYPPSKVASERNAAAADVGATR